MTASGLVLSDMYRRRLVWVAIAVTLCAGRAFGQAPPTAPGQDLPPKGPSPLWDLEVGGSFVGTSGNSDTSSTGGDFSGHRRGLLWKIDATATAIKTTNDGSTKAERYLGTLRVDRTLTSMLSLSTGETAEHDRFAGINFRNILDAGLSWALVKQSRWTLDGVTSLAWNHEVRTVGQTLNDPTGLFQLLSRIPIGATGDTTQRITFYPDFRTSSAYRSEAELTAKAAMNAHLTLKIGYLLRYSNAPVVGFKQTDHTTTASVLFHWKASASAPHP